MTGTFCGIFGVPFTTVTVTATAAHRPRDVAIVLDYSGSMNNESDLWNVESYLGNMVNTPNNTDPVFPQFGPYNPTFSPNVTLNAEAIRALACAISPSRCWVSPRWPPIFTRTTPAPAQFSAFTPASNVSNVPVAGDNYLTANGKCVLTWSDAVNPNTSFFPGYSNFQGFTQGPKYWGKTFFIWPPQPGTDWRKLYFKLTNGSPLNDNTKLWNSTGAWNNPPNNYQINYAAILNWIKNTGPNPFPPQLRAGNVLYYSAIPTDVPASAYNPSNPNSQITNPNQRFWKEYIDYTIGVWLDPNGTIQVPGTRRAATAPTSLRAAKRSQSLAPITSISRATRPLFPNRQPATASAPSLVRAHDDDSVHVGHGNPPRYDPRHLDDCRQAGDCRAFAGHPEQPPERYGVAAHVQSSWLFW